MQPANAVGKINSNSGALDSNASSALGAANAQNEYFKELATNSNSNSNYK